MSLAGVVMDLEAKVKRLERERDEARAERDNANLAREEEWKRANAVETQLREAREEIARLTRERDDACKHVARLGLQRGAEAKRADDHRAALGRAVAALKMYHVWQRCEEEGDEQLLAFIAEMNAIFADPTSAQAGAYVAALEREHIAAIAYRDSGVELCGREELTAWLDALAAVDARRGAR